MTIITSQRDMHIGELDKSIIELSKRKLKLLQEITEINESISFLRQQEESPSRSTCVPYEPAVTNTMARALLVLLLVAWTGN